jgi:tRNA-splicing ligase RtcB
MMDPNIEKQLLGAANLPIVGPHVAIMPDAHVGIGCTVGAVIPTVGAIIPAGKKRKKRRRGERKRYERGECH